MERASVVASSAATFSACVFFSAGCLLWVSFHYVLVKWVPAHYCNGASESSRNVIALYFCVRLVLSLVLFLSFVERPPPPHPHPAQSHPHPRIVLSLFL